MKFIPSITLLATLLLTTVAAGAEKATEERIIKDGMLVTLHYTLNDTSGKLIETSNGKEPIKYIHGRRMMIPGLEKELAGMKVGDEKHVTVKPEEGYGLVNKDAFQELPKEKVPASGLKVGAILTGQGTQGQPVQARVHEIKEKTVVVDFNHPMAGKTLVFDVKVIDIQPAPTASPQSTVPGAPAKPSAPAPAGGPADAAPKK
jgi:FKBP-type peptidyl-prolyl cis-trans isomerase SlyD